MASTDPKRREITIGWNDGSEFAFTASANTDLVDSEYRSVGELEPVQGQGIVLGRGRSANPLQAEGFIYGTFDNTGATTITGGGRVEVRTKAGTLVGYLYSTDLDEITAGASTRSDRKPFPIQTMRADGKNVAVITYPYVLHLALQSDDSSGETFDYDAAGNSLKMEGYVVER